MVGRPWRRSRRARSRGQSLAEFALVLPVLLLILLVAIDFGRVYLGYVNLQQMVRIAGAFASEHAAALDQATPDPTVLGEYRDLVINDSTAINCDLPSGAISNPMFPAGHDLGDPIDIAISCNFHILTPIISDILGGTVVVSASTTSPVREGAVAEVPGGGGPISIAPIADFVGSPTSGFAENDGTGHLALDVTLTDLSRNAPTGWQWNFDDGTGAVFTQGPQVHHFVCDKSPGDTCTFTVSLTVSSAGGSDTMSKADYVTLTVPPTTGPIAEFTASPTSGVAPPALSVNFAFVDERLNAVTYSNYDWDFGDGQTGAGATTTHSYPNPGSYDVSLTVTEAGTGATNTQVKTSLIIVSHKICTVPDFANRQEERRAGSMERRRVYHDGAVRARERRITVSPTHSRSSAAPSTRSRTAAPRRSRWARDGAPSWTRPGAH